MADEDNESALVNEKGEPADEAFAFEIERRILGRRVTGFRYCGNEPVDGKDCTTFRLSFEDDADLMVAVEVQEGKKTHMHISVPKMKELPECLTRVM